MSLDKEVPINFGSHPDLESEFRIRTRFTFAEVRALRVLLEILLDRRPHIGH